MPTDRPQTPEGAVEALREAVEKFDEFMDVYQENSHAEAAFSTIVAGAAMARQVEVLLAALPTSEPSKGAVEALRERVEEVLRGQERDARFFLGPDDHPSDKAIGRAMLDVVANVRAALSAPPAETGAWAGPEPVECSGCGGDLQPRSRVYRCVSCASLTTANAFGGDVQRSEMPRPPALDMLVTAFRGIYPGDGTALPENMLARMISDLRRLRAATPVDPPTGECEECEGTGEPAPVGTLTVGEKGTRLWGGARYLLPARDGHPRFLATTHGAVATDLPPGTYRIVRTPTGDAPDTEVADG